MSKIGDKLRDFGEGKFRSIKEFAEALEMSPPNLQQYLRGDREPGSPLLQKLFELGCDINWLLSDKKIATDVKVISEDKIHYISFEEFEKENPHNIIEIPLLADVPASAKLREIDFHEYPEYFGVKIDPKNHFAIKVHEEYGYSMSPAISPGDFIICNSNPKLIKDGDLVLVQYDSTMGAIKKYHKNKELKAVTLYSTNTAEPPVTLHENKIKQMFKVTHIIKM